MAQLEHEEVPVIEVRGLTAGYRGTRVLHGVDLEVRRGEVVALLGPNGAGKTTTLLAISGLLPASTGEVYVLGDRVHARHPYRVARRGLAHVPEDRSLFGRLTVRENLRLGNRDKTGSLERTLDLFPSLRAIMGRTAAVLSGGEQQMLAIARALISRPQALLVDEMSHGLAPTVVADLAPAIRRTATDTGAGILLVEQHTGLALDIADRAYVLSRGSVALEGACTELSAHRDRVEAAYFEE
jgi:branched-chain amino acid transport system ATP-binding protein